MKRIKLILILSTIYAVFVIAIPRLLILNIPCLDTFSNQTVEYRDCNLIQVSNYYLTYAFAGLISVLLIFAFLTKMKLKKELILLGVVQITIFLFGYYTFLPNAEKITLESNVYLDTFYEEYAANGEHSTSE